MERSGDRSGRTVASALAASMAFAPMEANAKSFDDQTRFRCVTDNCEVADDGKRVVLEGTPGSFVNAELGCPIGWNVADADLKAASATALNVTATPDGVDGAHAVRIRVPNNVASGAVQIPLHCTKGSDSVKAVAEVKPRADLESAEPRGVMVETVDLTRKQTRYGVRFTGSSVLGQVGGKQMGKNVRLAGELEVPNEQGDYRLLVGPELFMGPDFRFREGTNEGIQAIAGRIAARVLSESGFMFGEAALAGGADARGRGFGDTIGIAYGELAAGIRLPDGLHGTHFEPRVSGLAGARGDRFMGGFSAGFSVSSD